MPLDSTVIRAAAGANLVRAFAEITVYGECAKHRDAETANRRLCR
jgi:hypothetical protein